MHTRFVRVGCAIAIPILFGLASAESDRDEPLASAPTLSAVVEYALANHPAIATQTARWHANTEAVAPASTWPDPQIGVSLTNVGVGELTVGDQPMAQLRVQAMQRIPRRGTLMHAEEAAQGFADASRITIEERRNDVAAEAGRAALRVYHLDKRLAIQRQISQMLRQITSATEARAAVGTVRQEGVLGVMLERETLDARITRAEGERSSLVEYLNVAIHREPGTPLDSIVVAQLTDVPADVDAVDHPTLLHRRAMTRAWESRVALVERKRYPDPALVVGYGYRGDLRGVYTVGVTMPLPVHRDRRQDAAVRSAARLLEASQHDLEATTRAVVGRNAALAVGLSATVGFREAYERDLLPRAAEALDAAHASYVAGQTTLISVLDAVRRLHSLRLEALAAEVSQRMETINLAHSAGRASSIATTGETNHE